jgi:hypothetical protein
MPLMTDQHTGLAVPDCFSQPASVGTNYYGARCLDFESTYAKRLGWSAAVRIDHSNACHRQYVMNLVLADQPKEPNVVTQRLLNGRPEIRDDPHPLIIWIGNAKRTDRSQPVVKPRAADDG